jgi:hypothetical protein
MLGPGCQGTVAETTCSFPSLPTNHSTMMLLMRSSSRAFSCNRDLRNQTQSQCVVPGFVAGPHLYIDLHAWLASDILPVIPYQPPGVGKFQILSDCRGRHQKYQRGACAAKSLHSSLRVEGWKFVGMMLRSPAHQPNFRDSLHCHRARRVVLHPQPTKFPKYLERFRARVYAVGL